MSWSLALRQIAALMLMAILMAVISSALELLGVFRSAVQTAETEAQLAANAVRRQLIFQAADHPGVEVAELSQDVRVQMVLNDALAHGASILHLAVCDTAGIAVEHTVPEALGEPVLTRPSLPQVESPLDAAAALRQYWGSDEDFQVVTLLSDREGAAVGSIRVFIGRTFLQHELDTALKRGALTAGFVALIAIVAGALLAGIAMRRVRVLEAGVTALREGRFEAELPESGLSEFDRLARELNLLGREYLRRKKAGESPPHPAADLLGNGILLLDPARTVVFANHIARERLRAGPLPRGSHLETLLPTKHPLLLLLRKLSESPGRSLAIQLPTLSESELVATHGGLATAEGSSNPGETLLGRDVRATDDTPDTQEDARCVAVAHRIEGDTDDAGILIEIKPESSLAQIHFLVDQSRVLRRLGEMAAGVAHELRGPLQSIHFDLEALRSSLEQNPESMRGLIEGLHDKVQRLEWAVKGFLKVARLRPLKMQMVDLGDLLQETCDELQAEALMSGIELRLDLPAESITDQLSTQGDREVLSQAIKNLISNAIQAQPSRTGEVIVRLREPAPNDSLGATEASAPSSTGSESTQVRIEVVDTGPGIAHELRDRIFDLYFTTRKEGTGVGLAIVRQTAELHRGSCVVESTPEGGTTMALLLPPLESSPLIG